MQVFSCVGGPLEHGIVRYVSDVCIRWKRLSTRLCLLSLRPDGCETNTYLVVPPTTPKGVVLHEHSVAEHHCTTRIDLTARYKHMVQGCGVAAVSAFCANANLA